MKFVCDRCGKKYATAEDPTPGRVYKLKCKACGNLIVVRAPAAGAAGSSSGKATRRTPMPSIPAITPPPLPPPPADPSGLSLDIGAPEPAGTQGDPLGGFPGLFNDSTTEISVSAFSPSLTGETPPPTPPPSSPSTGPGYVDLFADIAGPPPAEEKKDDDPFLAAARASLPDSFGSGSSSKPDIFASLSSDRLPALGAEPSAQQPSHPTPKIPVIPKPPQQKSGMPIALIAGGVVVLVGILAFTVLGGGKKPSAKPRPAASGQAQPAASAQAQPAAPAQAQPAPQPQAPVAPSVQQPSGGAAPAPDPGKAAKAEEERRASEEARKREREQQDRAAREEKDRIAREAKAREREERAARARDSKEARDRALAERAAKDREAKEARERDKAERAARDKEVREAKAREREERDRQAREAKEERQRKAAEAKAERERQAREAKAERERRVQEAAERERQERERREGDKVASASAGDGGLTPAQMEKVLSSTKKAFDGCIQSAKGSDVKLDGRKVMLRLNIQTSGAVTYPTLDDVTLNGTELGSCLKNAARLMVFPKFSGDTMHVEVPLVLASR